MLPKYIVGRSVSRLSRIQNGVTACSFFASATDAPAIIIIDYTDTQFDKKKSGMSRRTPDQQLR